MTLIKGFNDRVVRNAYAKGNELTIQVDKNDYQIGEILDIDTDKMKVRGKVVWSLEKLVKISITQVFTKGVVN